MFNTTVILLNWNSTSSTLEALRELERAQGTFGLIILDNGSRETEREALISAVPLSGLKRVTLLQEPENLGFAGGVNVCLRHARSQPGYQADESVFLLLNNDVELRDLQVVSKLSDFLATHPGVGVVGPLIESGSDTPTGLQSMGWVNLWTGTTPIEFTEPEQEFTECEFVHGCALAFRGTLLDQIGDLDEGYFAYYEESDFCLRARARGWKVGVLKSARIFHEGGVSVGRESPMKEFLMLRNRMALVQRNGSWMQRGSALAHLLSYQGPKRIARALVHQDLKLAQAAVLGVLHGSLGLRGKPPKALT